MGEPAVPTTKDREEARSLARAIVESVRNDEAMPLLREELREVMNYATPEDSRQSKHLKELRKQHG